MEIKKPCTPIERYKERFIVQFHNNKEKLFLVRPSKIIRYRNLSLVITLSTALDFKIQSQDVTQPYINVHDLTRALYAKPTPYFRLPSYQLLKLLKQLYWVTDSGDAQLHTYNKYLTHTLKYYPKMGTCHFTLTTKENWMVYQYYTLITLLPPN